MKTNFRHSKTDRSTLRRIDLIIRRGWRPGLRPALFYRGNRRSRQGAAGRAI
jgi:hypothetical protein